MGGGGFSGFSGSYFCCGICSKYRNCEESEQFIIIENIGEKHILGGVATVAIRRSKVVPYPNVKRHISKVKQKCRVMKFILFRHYNLMFYLV